MSKHQEQARRIKLLETRRIPFELLAEQQKVAVMTHFIEEFMEEEKRESLLLNLQRSQIKQKPVDYHKYFPSSCLRDVSRDKVNLFDWLSRKGQTRCYLFWTEPWVGAFQVETSALDDIHLFFFSDSYWVNFEAGRALSLTRDGELIFCEI